MARQNWMLPAILLVVGSILISCKKKYEYTEKTPEQRRQDYRQHLTTSDLSVFGLQGSVKEAIYPNGFWSAQFPEIPASPDTIRFTENGQYTPSSQIQGDTLQPQRRPDGCIEALEAPMTQNRIEIIWSEEGQLLGYRWKEKQIKPTQSPPQPTIIYY